MFFSYLFLGKSIIQFAHQREIPKQGELVLRMFHSLKNLLKLEHFIDRKKMFLFLTKFSLKGFQYLEHLSIFSIPYSVLIYYVVKYIDRVQYLYY